MSLLARAEPGHADSEPERMSDAAKVDALSLCSRRSACTVLGLNSGPTSFLSKCRHMQSGGEARGCRCPGIALKHLHIISHLGAHGSNLLISSMAPEPKEIYKEIQVGGEASYLLPWKLSHGASVDASALGQLTDPPWFLVPTPAISAAYLFKDCANCFPSLLSKGKGSSFHRRTHTCFLTGVTELQGEVTWATCFNSPLQV